MVSINGHFHLSILTSDQRYPTNSSRWDFNVHDVQSSSGPMARTGRKGGQLSALSLCGFRHWIYCSTWSLWEDMTFLDRTSSLRSAHAENNDDREFRDSSADLQCVYHSFFRCDYWESTSALAGWIPEHIHLRSSDFQREKTWLRILQGYQNGLSPYENEWLLILTSLISYSRPMCPYSGYGRVDRSVLRRTATPPSCSLLRSHRWAIVLLYILLPLFILKFLGKGVQVSGDDERQLIILDSWIRHEKHVDDNDSDHEQSSENSRQSRACNDCIQHLLHETGSFILFWDAVCELFDGVYLSWDPSAFSNQLVFHG